MHISRVTYLWHSFSRSRQLTKKGRATHVNLFVLRPCFKSSKVDIDTAVGSPRDGEKGLRLSEKGIFALASENENLRLRMRKRNWISFVCECWCRSPDRESFTSRSTISFVFSSTYTVHCWIPSDTWVPPVGRLLR